MLPYTVPDTSGNTGDTLRELIVERSPVFTIMLEWVAPEFRQYGVPLSLADIAGYKVYMGNDDSNMDVIALVADLANSLEVEELSRRVYYIAISAIDENQLESPTSEAVRINFLFKSRSSFRKFIDQLPVRSISNSQFKCITFGLFLRASGQLYG